MKGLTDPKKAQFPYIYSFRDNINEKILGELCTYAHTVSKDNPSQMVSFLKRSIKLLYGISGRNSISIPLLLSYELEILGCYIIHHVQTGASYTKVSDVVEESSQTKYSSEDAGASVREGPIPLTLPISHDDLLFLFAGYQAALCASVEELYGKNSYYAQNVRNWQKHVMQEHPKLLLTWAHRDFEGWFATANNKMLAWATDGRKKFFPPRKPAPSREGNWVPSRNNLQWVLIEFFGLVAGEKVSAGTPFRKQRRRVWKEIKKDLGKKSEGELMSA
jgi:hypothetical protein